MVLRDASANRCIDVSPLEPRRMMHGDDAHFTPGPILDPASAPSGPLTTSSDVVINIPGVPVLNSRPGASAKLFLDFNGAPATAWGAYEVPATPAYDTDDNPAAFSTDEVAAIREICARVAEKYSPFNLNVTTVDPGMYLDRVTMRSVIGGDGAWTGATGRSGVAFVGAFANTASNTAWTFANTFPTDRRAVAESICHEAGHGFGLNHQSVYDAAGVREAEYNRGDSSSAPVMGTSFYATRGLWWNGPTTSVTTIQNDTTVSAGGDNGFGYRPDDHGSTGAAATALARSGSSLSGKGVIEKTSDVDLFKFTTAGGSVTLNVNVASVGATLDARLVVHNGAGVKVASRDTGSLGESVTFTAAAGTYYLTVYSEGANVGDVGQYTVTGSAAAPGATARTRGF